jgi:peroxiredoxin
MTALATSTGTSRRQWLGATLAWAALGSACSSGRSAPDTRFVLLDGSQTSTQALRGKVFLINFWATSCISCVAEMPKLVQTHQQFKARGFETLAVAMSYDPPAYVANFAETRKLPFAVVIDNTGAIARAFDDTKITPTTFLLDKRGRIVKRYVGEPDFAELDGLVGKLLAEA